MAIEAVPRTVILAFQQSSYKEAMEVSIQAVEQTFHTEPAKIRHPLKHIIRSGMPNLSTSICPACAMSDTSYEAGAGVTLVPGGSTQKFRALLTVVDKQATTDRADDASPVVRCSRKVRCELRAPGDNTTYTLMSVGSLNIATRLHAPRKGETLHAIVSWRSSTDLALVAFITAGENETDAAAFKALFEAEVRLNKAAVEGTAGALALASDGATPSKRHKDALDASRLLTTPEPWAKRNRSEGGGAVGDGGAGSNGAPP